MHRATRPGHEPSGRVTHSTRRRVVTVDHVATMNRWQNLEEIVGDLADLADNSPDHHTAVTAARALSVITWQAAVVEELKGTVATLEHWAGVHA